MFFTNKFKKGNGCEYVYVLYILFSFINKTKINIDFYLLCFFLHYIRFTGKVINKLLNNSALKINKFIIQNSQNCKWIIFCYGTYI